MYKSYLKGIKNEDGNYYYINEFYSPEKLESRRYQQKIFKENDDAGANKKSMNFKKGELWVGSEKFAKNIQPPNAQDLLDMTVEEVQEVSEMEINNGPSIEKEQNRFIGYTVCANNIKKIQRAYFKLRLMHPKARHILCAYYIDEEEEESYHRKGYCDDGEYAAASKLLEILTDNCMENRAIFVVRYYSGNKLGQGRFECIREAAEECLKLNLYNSVTKETQDMCNDDMVSQSSYDKEETNARIMKGEQPGARGLRIKQNTWRDVRGRRPYRGGRGAGTRKQGFQSSQGNPKRLRHSSSPEYQINKRKMDELYQNRWNEQYDHKYPPIHSDHSYYY